MSNKSFFWNHEPCTYPIFRFSDTAASLLSGSYLQVFTDNLQTFRNLSQLVPQSVSLPSPTGFSFQLENHGVVLLELDVDISEEIK